MGSRPRSCAALRAKLAREQQRLADLEARRDREVAKPPRRGRGRAASKPAGCGCGCGGKSKKCAAKVSLEPGGALITLDPTRIDVAAVDRMIEEMDPGPSRAPAPPPLPPLPPRRGQASMFAPQDEGFALTVQQGRFGGARPSDVQPALFESAPDGKAMLERKVNEMAERAAQTGGIAAYNDVRRGFGFEPVRTIGDAEAEARGEVPPRRDVPTRLFAQAERS